MTERDQDDTHHHTDQQSRGMATVSRVEVGAKGAYDDPMVLALFRQLFSSSPDTGAPAGSVRVSGCLIKLPVGARGSAPMGPWTLSTGEQLEIAFARGEPPLPKVELWVELVEHLKAHLPAGSRLVECEPVVVNGHPGLSSIVRTDVKDGPTGYKGRLIIPLRDRWWDITVTAVEIRSSVDRDATLAASHAEPGGKLPADWNPDASKFDFRFPNHAVTRMRKHLEFIANKADFDAALNGAPAWALPSWSATPSGVMVAVSHKHPPANLDD